MKTALRDIKYLLDDFADSRRRIKLIQGTHNLNLLKKVGISTKSSSFAQNIKLQTPNQLGVWGDTAFILDFHQDINVILNRSNPWLKLKKNPENNWMLHIEPPGYIQKLGLGTSVATKQFGRVYTSDPRLYEKGGKFIASPPYVHWHLAVNSYSSNADNLQYDYDFLKSYSQVPTKEVSLVAINSRIADLPGHRLRADFIKKISERNFDFELYGTDNWSIYKQYKGRTTNGKWPIYSRSKYVLTIENEVSDYYWTEKFTDALLCFSMPIYYGSPKINQYFPEGSYIPLDITKPSAVDDLREIIRSDFYEQNLPKLLEARNLVLAKHNLFNFIDSELTKYN